jgi:hypothetical protein
MKTITRTGGPQKGAVGMMTQESSMNGIAQIVSRMFNFFTLTLATTPANAIEIFQEKQSSLPKKQ